MTRSERRRPLAGLLVALLGAGALQAAAVSLGSDESTQFLVVGLSAVVMFLALGAMVWVLRVGVRL